MWPEGRSCAAAFTFDFDAEEVWLAEDPANASRPGILSMGTYGARVGVPLILELLERHGVTGTFFVVGRNAERHEGRVRQMIAAGHEVAVHGYTHSGPAGLSRDEEEAELVRAREVLEGLGGVVSGYRSPSWDVSEHTLGLLQTHGFRYASNFMDDLRPYVHPGTSIVELPVQWMLDDAPHFWFEPSEWSKKISTTSEVREIWEEELLGIRDLGGSCILTMHPQIIGRPSRLRMLDEFIAFVRSLDDVWIATCAEIADRARPEG